MFPPCFFRALIPQANVYKQATATVLNTVFVPPHVIKNDGRVVFFRKVDHLIKGVDSRHKDSKMYHLENRNKITAPVFEKQALVPYADNSKN